MRQDKQLVALGALTPILQLFLRTWLLKFGRTYDTDNLNVWNMLSNSVRAETCVKPPQWKPLAPGMAILSLLNLSTMFFFRAEFAIWWWTSVQKCVSDTWLAVCLTVGYAALDFLHVYIQDLSSCFTLTKLFKYADDCTALKAFKSVNTFKALTELGQDLKRASRWREKWKTTFEPKNTHAMLTTNAKDC